MIRTKGEPGTGDVIQAVRHMRKMNQQIRHVVSLREDELFEEAKQLAVPVELVKYVHENGKLHVVNFAAGGVARCRGSIRWLRYLQVGQPGKARTGHC